MTPSLRFLLLASCLVCSVPGIGDESGLLYLRNNPFSRPEIFNAPPPPPARPAAVIPPEQVELNLTATMVSDTTPMVVVDGELLAIGDEIEGMRLVAVKEGEAVFARAGKRFNFTIGDEKAE